MEAIILITCLVLFVTLVWGLLRHDIVDLQALRDHGWSEATKAADRIEQLEQHASDFHADICAENDNMKIRIEQLEAERKIVLAKLAVMETLLSQLAADNAKVRDAINAAHAPHPWRQNGPQPIR